MTVEIEEKPAPSVIPLKPITSQPHSMQCRGCGNTNISRIPRDRFVKTFLFWLPLKKYVCYRCHRKSYRWRSQN